MHSQPGRPVVDARLGRRVYLSALCAWCMVVALALAHVTFDPFRSEHGTHVFMLFAAAPMFLLGYGIWVGAIHMLWRRYRTRQLAVGLLLHVALGDRPSNVPKQRLFPAPRAR
jgi:hypothetical protein